MTFVAPFVPLFALPCCCPVFCLLPSSSCVFIYLFIDLEVKNRPSTGTGWDDFVILFAWHCVLLLLVVCCCYFEDMTFAPF